MKKTRGVFTSILSFSRLFIPLMCKLWTVREVNLFFPLISTGVSDSIKRMNYLRRIASSLSGALRMQTSPFVLVARAGHLIVALSVIAGPYMPLSYLIVYRNPNSILGSIESCGGAINLFFTSWSSVRFNDLECWIIIVCTGVWSFLSSLLPGREFQGPATISGFRPTYKKSGFLFYIISLAVIISCLWHRSVLHLYYSFTTFSGILWLLACLLSLYLFVKGHFDPSPGLFGPTDNPVIEFIRGLELYPRVGPAGLFDLKTIVHCRFSYILWQAVVLWAWKANYELHQANYLRGEINWPMTCTTILQTLYIMCFYLHEETFMSSNYLCSNRFGLEFCVSSTKIITFNTIVSLYLIKYSPIQSFGPYSFALITLSGVIFILLRFEADRQRLHVRRTRGKCTILGAQPAVIHAVYTTCDGTVQQSPLLVSGLWGQVRHLNYLLEILACFCWTLGPFTFFSSLIPFCPLSHLTCRLIFLASADDEKCLQKYGKYWHRYCSFAKYRMVPGVY